MHERQLSTLEQEVIQLLQSDFPNQFQLHYHLVGESVLLFSPKLKVAVDVNDETHDHSDAYFRFVGKQKKLEKEGILYYLIETFDAKESIKALRSQLKTLQN